MKLKHIILFATLLLLISCNLKSPGVPKEKLNYVGRWESLSMKLVITKDGSVEYERVEAGTSKSANAPLQKFEGDNFVIGALGINTTFVVSKPPHEENGIWKMTVDGEELQRTMQ
ncbi:hypothetical protein C3K47_13700 [Solitalea longa]|uniref:Lipocalin-like domain-containing protein n=1 Tax=Solitalea longa TaxID=2079460 RepID=A0A2S4ZZN0_9SPHI|nr:hypothetical protein [Solitalea longa]POY35801.1 hypothetical protein C3K47_13700 [Solitalea longa]